MTVGTLAAGGHVARREGQAGRGHREGSLALQALRRGAGARAGNDLYAVVSKFLFFASHGTDLSTLVRHATPIAATTP